MVGAQRRGASASQEWPVLSSCGIFNSSTPYVYLTAASVHGIPSEYCLLDTLDLDLPETAAKGFDGLNVSFPLNRQMIPLMGKPSCTARAEQPDYPVRLDPHVARFLTVGAFALLISRTPVIVRRKEVVASFHRMGRCHPKIPAGRNECVFSH